jgi:arylsulfatase A-like enzyme
VNIIFIVSDTFRRDNLNCYGGYQVKTPNIDRLSEKSVIFNRCYICSFPTMPARADLFTGKRTYTFMGWEPLPRKEVILSEILSENGYMTAGIVDNPFFIKNGYGYDRGFSDFIWIRGQGSTHEDVKKQRRYETDHCAPSTMLTAARWLERNRGKKFFLYVDTHDPHEPWDPPKWYTELYYSNYDGKIVYPCYWKWRENVNGNPVNEEDLKLAYASYKGEATMVDRWVGFLLNKIECMNLIDDTAIIFTTDHGFYFGEHGYFGKQMINYKEWKIYRSPLYEEITHIPLLMYLPSVEPKRVDSLVSLPELMPTILDIAKAKIPKNVQVESFLPLIKGEDAKENSFVVSTHPIYNPGQITREVDALEGAMVETPPSTITSKNWTLIYSSKGEIAELYHLPSDPKQEKNLIDEEETIAKKLLDKFVSQLEKAGTEKRLLDRRRNL